MSGKEFFEKRTEQSKFKTEIVRKYFWIWAKIISNQVIKRGGNKIGYVDLFAGRGRYEDDSKSTPLLILERAVETPQLSQMLVTLFNDEDEDYSLQLQKEIDAIPDINNFKFKPIVRNYTVDDSLAEKVKQAVTFPSLFFLDPCGYKGLSLKLIEIALNGWGCDCIFFFNYNRINQHLSNSVLTENMDSLFGKSRTDFLRQTLIGKNPAERESLIVNSLKEALIELGGTYNIEYFFKDDSGKKTSHFLVFASKSKLGYDKMKDVMARESSTKHQGVSSFGFNPKDKDREPSLLDLMYFPIDDLAEELIKLFAGKTLTVKEIYYSHHIGTEFVLKNYQDALRKLEQQGKITANPNSNNRRKVQGVVTFGENVVVSFPST